MVVSSDAETLSYAIALRLPYISLGIQKGQCFSPYSIWLIISSKLAVLLTKFYSLGSMLELWDIFNQSMAIYLA